MMINATTKLVGLIGWPVSHSFSPLMHNQSFEIQGLNYCYLPLPVSPENLAQAVDGLKAMGFKGANVTIPHKVDIIKYLDEIDKDAKMIGAVNTLLVKDGKIKGYNTDAKGFLMSLYEKNVTVKGKNVLILGAGGAARAVVCGLIEGGIESITVSGKNAQKISSFVSSFKSYVDIKGCIWQEEAYTNSLKNCDLVVNCTPLGMFPNTASQPPIDFDRLNPSAVVCDLVYNPMITQLLANAQTRNFSIVSGLGMLVFQGALAYEIWTGSVPDTKEMYKVIREKIGV